jgi:hypothetical protein
MKYIVFTKQYGYAFYICHNESKGFYVSSDAPDEDVLKYDNYADAKAMADRNSNSSTTYAVKKFAI